MPDYHTNIEDLIAEGDKVVARVTMTGTFSGDFYGIPPTGRQVNLMGIDSVRIADGKIVEHGGEEDGVKVLRQPGFTIKLEPTEGLAKEMSSGRGIKSTHFSDTCILPCCRAELHQSIFQTSLRLLNFTAGVLEHPECG